MLRYAEHDALETCATYLRDTTLCHSGGQVPTTYAVSHLPRAGDEGRLRIRHCSTTHYPRRR